MNVFTKALLLLFFICGTTATADTIPVAVYNKPPYMIEKDKTGFFIDLFREAATLAQLDYTLSFMPNKRIKLGVTEGKKYLEPGVSQLWRKEFDSISIYTDTYIEVGDVLVVHKENIKQFSSLEDLEGQVVGTVRSYTYHEGFQEKFKKKVLIREDTDSHRQNVLKLHYKRVDGIIIEENTLLYYLRELHLPQDEYVIIYEFKKAPIAMRLEKSFTKERDTLNAALAEMKQNNRIEVLMKKYTD